MTEKRSRTREAPISYRPPSDRRMELLARQLQSGLSMNAFITESIFGQQANRRPILKDRDAAHLLASAAQLRELADTLTAALPESPENKKVAEDLDREFLLLRTAIIAATGRST